MCSDITRLNFDQIFLEDVSNLIHSVSMIEVSIMALDMARCGAKWSFFYFGKPGKPGNPGKPGKPVSHRL